MAPADKDMLRRIGHAIGGCLPYAAIFLEGAAQRKRLDALKARGYVEACRHPTMLSNSGQPLIAYRLTSEGRAAWASAP